MWFNYNYMVNLIFSIHPPSLPALLYRYARFVGGVSPNNRLRQEDDNGMGRLL